MLTFCSKLKFPLQNYHLELFMYNQCKPARLCSREIFSYKLHFYTLKGDAFQSSSLQEQWFRRRLPVSQDVDSYKYLIRYLDKKIELKLKKDYLKYLYNPVEVRLSVCTYEEDNIRLFIEILHTTVLYILRATFRKPTHLHNKTRKKFVANRKILCQHSISHFETTSLPLELSKVMIWF